MRSFPGIEPVPTLGKCALTDRGMRGLNRQLKLEAAVGRGRFTHRVIVIEGMHPELEGR